MQRVALAVMVLLLVGCQSLLPEPREAWALLTEQRVDEPYTVRIATDDRSLEQLWQAMGLQADLPIVAWSTTVVVSFSQGIGSGCQELRLDDVVIDPAAQVVYPVITDPLAPRGCDADLVGGRAFVVTMDRRSLPEMPFRVRLVAPDQNLPCGGDCGNGVPSEVIVQ